MPALSDFRLGAEVVDVEGEPAGTLASVLVEQDGFDARAIVVKDETSLVGRLLGAERLLITDEVMIPISSVASATHEQVHLSITAADVRTHEPYIGYRFRSESAGAAVTREAQLLGGGLGVPDVEEVAIKPEGAMEINRDENVMIGQTGRRFGKVHDVLYDNGELIGVVVQPEGFFKEDVVLPIRFIVRSDDMALFADIGEKDIENLKPFGKS
jgi:PRC-barrel domain